MNKLYIHVIVCMCVLCQVLALFFSLASNSLFGCDDALVLSPAHHSAKSAAMEVGGGFKS